ncbi:TPA: GtrA family protein [Candidatus Berkelbacteria bacterium]|uniref:GtrA/DPMS transmembrane domain-containing protein n=1 Tax=Berkelbacteria bacterium GW2011_GWE1_39_12 TaxID=1618337 RepID=A0A0G4B2H6_9BACT|nr:MAG: hypothetical protein UT28_C0001G0357 [Berkelbacteria bacterium GW2011_GWE1_39_12]HBO60744.1 GtrA family protein [Candidatus Berkelbacteria bacterium]
MKDFLQSKMVRQFVKFGVVGFSSFIVDAGIYFVETRYLGIYYIVAKGVSFLVSVINSYTWNRRWTFKSANEQKTQEFGKFLIVSTVGFGLNLSIMYLTVSVLRIFDFYGLLIATAVVMVWNFSANKFWVFKETVVTT